MSMQCFDECYAPTPRRGFSPIEAVEFARREFPSEPAWVCWRSGQTWCAALDKLADATTGPAGEIAGWRWRRLPSAYPELGFWNGGDDSAWTGFLEINGPGDTRFLLFGFLNSLGMVGNTYLASTRDVAALDRFGRDVTAHFFPEDQPRITVWGERPLKLDAADEEVFLPVALRADIEEQVLTFFGSGETFARFGLRHRRGLLFVGPPGTGKTMFTRQLARQCHARFKTRAFALPINRDTTDDDVGGVFLTAARCGPALLILEDLDALARDAQVSRATLLRHLDGLDAPRGVLVIGTTNHPGDIDPALAHRPSRFDRVWQFELPDRNRRREYLAARLPELPAAEVDQIADQTAEWSYAYLNELRCSAAIFALHQRQPAITAPAVRRAHELLAAQFQAGQKNHQIRRPGSAVGFRAA